MTNMSIFRDLTIDPPMCAGQKAAEYTIANSWNGIAGYDETADNCGMFDPSTGLVTIPQSGYYLINGSIFFDTNTTGRRFLQIEVGTDAAGSNTALIRQEITPGGYLCCNITRDMVPLLSLDTLRMSAYQTSGASMTVRSLLSPTVFSVRRVH